MSTILCVPTFLMIRFIATFSHHIALLVFDSCIWWYLQNGAWQRTMHSANFRFKFCFRFLFVAITKKYTTIFGSFNILSFAKSNDHWCLVEKNAVFFGNLQSPFERMFFDGLIQVFQNILGEVTAIVQLGQVFDELGASHFSADILSM